LEERRGMRGREERGEGEVRRWGERAWGGGGRGRLVEE